jgi:hypothetical protein
VDNTVFSNVSWIELFWVILMTGGGIISIFNVWDGFKDKRAMKKQKINGVAKVLVDATIKQDASRAVQFLLLLAIGVFACLSPPIIAEELHGFFWWARTTSLVAILGTGILLTYNAVIARLSARKALQLTALRRKKEVNQ